MFKLQARHSNQSTILTNDQKCDLFFYLVVKMFLGKSAKITNLQFSSTF